MVADELRFTNMFKLVDYCLRLQRGCRHVRQPDLAAFMTPAGGAQRPAAAAAAAAATAAAAAAMGPAAAGGAKEVSGTAAGTQIGPSATGTAAAAIPAAAAPKPAGPGAETAGDGGEAGGCGCGDLGLPEMAAEKLTVVLLLLSETAGWPSEARPSGADAAASAAATGVRHCGRARCRRCRQRAAAAGDRAAAMELLRERWRQMLGLAPLGLFASSPVLEDELSYLRLQLSCLEQQQQQVA